MAGTPTLVAEAWFDQVLLADADFVAASPGGLWNEVAPEDTRGVYTVTNLLHGDNDATATGDVYGATLTYALRVWGQSENYADLVPAVRRVVALLHGASAVLADVGTVEACTWTNPIKLPLETDETGRVWACLGAQFDVEVTEMEP
jgi:hypothetical protein